MGFLPFVYNNYINYMHVCCSLSSMQPVYPGSNTSSVNLYSMYTYTNIYVYIANYIYLYICIYLPIFYIYKYKYKYIYRYLSIGFFVCYTAYF